MPKFAEPAEPAAPAQVILAASGREIAFAPLLPSSHAGYLLIRGLPATAKLSAGRQSESGTWLVKGDYVSDLTLTMGDAAPGDYPVEVYVLQSGDGPQARRSLVLRVEAPAQPFTYATYAPDMGWASALLDVVPAAQAAEQRPPFRRPKPRCCMIGRSGCCKKAISPRHGCSCSISPSAAKATRPTISPAPSIATCWPSSAPRAWTAIPPARAAGTSAPRRTATPRPPSA